MKTKNLVTLAVSTLVVVLLAILCLTGVQVGKYIVIPAADGIARGEDFTESTYVVLNVNEPAADKETAEEETADVEQTDATEEETQAVPASDELVEETVAVMQRRADMLTLKNISISRQGANHIRVEMPVADSQSASSLLYTLTQGCHVYIVNSTGETVLEGDDIVSCALGMNTAQTAYLVTIKVDEEALSAWADVTEDVNEQVTVYFDGTQICTSTAAQILSSGMAFTSYNDAVNVYMALETGRIAATVTTAASGTVPAAMSQEQFDRALIAFEIAVLVAAVIMIAVFKKNGFVSALSIVLTAVAVLYFYGLVPYMTFGVASFFALAAVLGVKMLCDVDMMKNVRKAQAEGLSGRDAVRTAWRVSGMKALEICFVAAAAALVMQYFGAESVSAFTGVFAVGSVIVLIVTAVFTRPLTTCAVEEPAKAAK